MNEPAVAQSQRTPKVIAMPRPDSVADLGIRKSFLEDLALKILYLTGPLPILELADRLRLSYRATDELFRRLREGLLCEVSSISQNVPLLTITGQGRARALELLSLNQYTGPAPVSLPSYVQQVKMQSVRNVAIHPPDIQRAFSHLVIDSKILTQLGTALNSGTSIFLHGPTGSGKTTIAENLTRVLALDKVWIPHAVEIDGEIIAVYDPIIHKKVDQPASEITDRRWVLCHRPAVMVGGELTIDMLDLQFNAVSKFYEGPVQMKANNGVLIIDDFGRQRLRPEELLNRWVVPLDRHIDFLQLAGGKKIEIPFDMFVVLATNMDVGKLVDEAFLRRIQTKVRIDYVTPEQFHRICSNYCQARKLECPAEVVDLAIELITKKYQQPLRACYPSDVINQICWAARYAGREPEMSRETVELACHNYFIVPRGE
jgi:predicted ATPase with chaperone activity